jgi:valyl-tRNA synthetase
MFSRLSVVAAEVDRALGQYRFDEAANAVYQFFWGEFCDWYLELIKLRLDFTNEEQQNLPGLITLGSLLTIFGAALRLLSPFMPFITEEIWQSYPDLFAALGGGEAGIKSIALAHFPRAADFPTDAKAESEMGLLQELITTVRAIRKELAVPEKESAPIQINAATEVAALAQTHSDILARTCRVSAVEIAPNALTGNNARSAPSFDVAVIYARQIDLAAERERLTRDLAKYEKGLTAAERQLSNEAFMAKAPAHIVEGLRKQAAETRTLRDKAKDALDGLPPDS